jgi:beta-lactamase regulating signal transducer with metallopeptidase domain/protein involved in polysaccharide export with SLBB domain
MKDAAALALVHFLWQGTVLALVAAVLMRAARGSAQARYAIGIVTLCAMAAAPVATTAWVIQAAPNTVVLEQSALVAAATKDLAADDAGAITLSPDRTPEGTVFPFTTAVLIVWMIGVLLLSGRLAGGWMIAHRLATHAVKPVVDELQQTGRRLAAQLRLSRPVRILESSAVAVPLMIGWLKPIVLLPSATIAGLAPDQLEALIAHELAHVRRHDYLVNLLQSLLETTLFYHPAVWWMSHRVRAEREHCCDDLAVGVTDRLTYVTALSHVAALAAPGVALAASDGSLRARVRRLLGPERDRRSGGGWLAILPVVLIVAAATPFAGSSPVEVVAPAAPAFEVNVPPPMAPMAAPAATTPSPAPPAQAPQALPLSLTADRIIAIGNVTLAQGPPEPPVAAPPKLAQVKPGETIVINVEGRPELSGTYVVQTDGSIKLKGVTSDTITVQVTGAVRMPGNVTLKASSGNVAGALRAAGGFASNAGSVEVERSAGGMYSATYLLERDRLDTDGGLELRNGDRVNVKIAHVFYINGEVNSKGEKIWSPGMTVAKALVLAGGTTEEFSLGRSHITRPVKDNDGRILKYEKIDPLNLETPILPDDTLVAGRKLRF